MTNLELTLRGLQLLELAGVIGLSCCIVLAGGVVWLVYAWNWKSKWRG